MQYIFFECPSCEFSSIQRETFNGSRNCPMCAEDNGRDVRMTSRDAGEKDKPEGFDARAEDQKAQPVAADKKNAQDWAAAIQVAIAGVANVRDVRDVMAYQIGLIIREERAACAALARSAMGCKLAMPFVNAEANAAASGAIDGAVKAIADAIAGRGSR